MHGAEDRGPFHLVLRAGAPGSGALTAAGRALLRWQRLIPAHNLPSRRPPFPDVMRLHRGLHDRTRPLVRADHDHALDAWQWTLRLDPRAPLEVQLAALLHDIERLDSEADARVEHLAPDYDAFKRAHAWAGAARARRLLALAGCERTTASRVEALISFHEGPGLHPTDPSAAQAVADADALSFFSLNCAGYLEYFGVARTRMKVDWTLRRMSPRARDQVRRARLPATVEAMLPP
ncbi:DUF4202 domain-containing protein [Myxococcota bacterium]|nr:DUF4202 domain-containing protein [Myxococcota bacterium]